MCTSDVEGNMLVLLILIAAAMSLVVEALFMQEAED